jgi:hypothetical protein
LEQNVPFGKMDVIVKRIESTLNRETEIKVVLKEDGVVPSDVNPSKTDPWIWQRFIKGAEYSAWFVCFQGKITFQAGHVARGGDTLYFDAKPVPQELEEAIGRLVATHNLTGQYCFDYFQEASTGRYYVIECNPRGSSSLETVSHTPGWAACFFGTDLRKRTKYRGVGYWFHRNCKPFAATREDAYFSLLDPLPLLIAECAWPLELLRVKGALKGGKVNRNVTGIPLDSGTPLTAWAPSLCEALGFNYHHIDVNIGKIIVPGPTPGRGYDAFDVIQSDVRGAYVRAQVWKEPKTPTPGPCVLCIAGDIANLLEASKAEVTRLQAEISFTRHSAFQQYVHSAFEQFLKEGKSYDAVFLPRELLDSLPAGLLAKGGRAICTDTMPGAVAK